MSAHVHSFTGVWSNFGPRGPQDVHYHVCFGMSCTIMLIGEGHNCDGKPESHREGRLADLVGRMSTTPRDARVMHVDAERGEMPHEH